MEQFGLRHRLVLASVKEQDFGKTFSFSHDNFDHNYFAIILAIKRNKNLVMFFYNKFCQRHWIFLTSSLVMIIAIVMKSGTFKGQIIWSILIVAHIPIPWVPHYSLFVLDEISDRINDNILHNK